jgi:hypothetical protein
MHVCWRGEIWAVRTEVPRGDAVSFTGGERMNGVELEVDCGGDASGGWSVSTYRAMSDGRCRLDPCGRTIGRGAQEI